MGVWFSEYRVRCLAEHLTPRLQQIMERAVLDVIRAELPALLLLEMERELLGEAPEHSGADAGREKYCG